MIRTKTGNDEDDAEPQLTSNKERTKSSKEIKVGGSRGNLKKLFRSLRLGRDGSLYFKNSFLLPSQSFLYDEKK